MRETKTFVYIRLEVKKLTRRVPEFLFYEFFFFFPYFTEFVKYVERVNGLTIGDCTLESFG